MRNIVEEYRRLTTRNRKSAFIRKDDFMNKNHLSLPSPIGRLLSAKGDKAKCIQTEGCSL